MKINIRHWLKSLLSLCLASSLFLGGCSVLQANSVDDTDNRVSNKEQNSLTANAGKSTMSDNLPRLNGKATVELVVNGSTIAVEVDGNNAPITAGNFVDLVDRGVYNGLTFHRVVKDPQPFVVQGGDPLGNGTGNFVDPDTGRPRYIPLEIKLEGDAEPTYSKAFGRSSPKVVLHHSRGAVAMARSQAPDSASCQFYFALADLEFLDGDYAVFGYVTQGMDVVDQIKQGDRMESVKVTQGAENLQK